MAGLNHIREAYEQVYSQIDERMDPEERALRRAEVADKKASRMEPKVAAKYAGSEARSAEREDKKSKGKHIHGMTDSYEVEGDMVDEKFVKSQNPPTGRKSLSDRQSYKGTETKPFRGSNPRSLRHEIARSSGTSQKPKNEEFEQIDEKCWPGYKKKGMKTMFGKRYPNCVKKEEVEIDEAKVDEKTPEWKRSAVRSQRRTDLMKTHGATKDSPLMKFVDRDRRAEHEERRGVKKEGRDYLERDHGGSEEEHAANVRFGKRMEKLQGSVLGGKKETSEKKLKEAVYGGEKKEPEDTRMTVTNADKRGNTLAYQKFKAGHKGYKAADHLTKEEMKLELIAHLRERALDAAEKKEKESVYKAIKPSKLAKTYPEKSPKELKSLRYAISTSQAKKNMDTSKSDKRYGTER